MQAFFAIQDDKKHLQEILMVRCHLARLMGEHKMKIVDVARETGLNRNTVTLLYKETAQRIELDALDKLCKLFSCEVGDLLEIQKNHEKNES
ncbi:helix-turn-helix domain-containing protein [Vreelandella indica]